MQSVWKKTGKCRKICEWAINAGSIAMMIVCHNIIVMTAYIYVLM